MPNSSWNGPGSSDRNLPSTYQKVLELMQDMEALANAGLVISTESMDVNNMPSDYTRNMTYELKKVDVIGLSGKDGITLDYILVQTVRLDQSEMGVEYPAWQCAYGDVAMRMYFRSEVEGNTWTEWVPVVDYDDILDYIMNNGNFEEFLKGFIEDNIEIPDIPDIPNAHRQFMQSDTQPGPDEQIEGDYWLEPIVSSDYFFQNIDTTEVTEIGQDSYHDYQFASTEEPSDITDSPPLEDFKLEEVDAAAAGDSESTTEPPATAEPDAGENTSSEEEPVVDEGTETPAAGEETADEEGGNT